MSDDEKAWVPERNVTVKQPRAGNVDVVPDVIVAEDDEAKRKRIRDILEEAYNVASYADGAAAWEAIQVARPLAVVTDLNMPELSGKELLSNIRHDSNLRRTPVVVVTGDDSVNAHVELLNSGADDYISTPFHKEELIARLRNVIRLRQQERELEVLNARLARINASLEELTVTDPLTDVGNRRAFDEKLSNELARARRGEIPLALLMVDVDYFRRFNDRYGHGAGDRCLTSVAKVMADTARRPADFVARFGGEEFCIILPDTDPDGAQSVADKIIKGIAELGISHEVSDVAKHVTVSIGLAAAGPVDNPEQLLARASQALHAAKKGGRNQMQRWQPVSNEETIFETLD